MAMTNKIILLNFLSVFPDRCRIIPPAQIWVKAGQKREERPKIQLHFKVHKLLNIGNGNRKKKIPEVSTLPCMNQQTTVMQSAQMSMSYISLKYNSEEQ